MSDIQKLAEKYHDKFGYAVGDNPEALSPERLAVITKGVRSALNKLEAAIGLTEQYEWTVEAAFAVAEIAVELGLDLDPGVRELHRSLMGLVWPDGEVHFDENGKPLRPDGYERAYYDDEVARQVVRTKIEGLARQLAQMGPDDPFTIPDQVSAAVLTAALSRAEEIKRDNARGRR